MAACDIAACAIFMALALYIRFGVEIPPTHRLAYLTYWPFLIIIRLLMACTFGLYDFKRRLSITDHVFGACSAAFFGIILCALFLSVMQLYYYDEIRLSRIVVLIELSLMTGWFAVSRVTMLLCLRWFGFKIRIMLIGPVEDCRELAGEIHEYAPRALALEGIATYEPNAEGENVIGHISDLEKVASDYRIDMAILVQSHISQSDLYNILTQCDMAGVDLFLYPQLGLTVMANSKVTSIAGLPLVSMQPGHSSSIYFAGKRVMDLLISVFLLILSLPVTIITAMAVRVSSPGKILFAQERIGLYGKPFRIFKFRTMKENAEAESGAILSQADDPRITSIGSVLRKLRIDELPQLWNILRGDMSIVGPRPERQEFISKFLSENPLYERRLLVKPGLTGLAQIHGRYDTDYTHKLRYDLIYINSISFATDVRILFSTIQTVLTGKGAT